MKKLGKLVCTLAGMIGAATSVVTVKNAINTKSDEEVGHKQGFYEKYAKRPMDFACASVAVIMLSPVLTGTALLVRINLGSPVLFTQERPGKDGKIFKLLKFRSMNEKRNEEGELLSDVQRITRFGGLLRKTSMDELPELFNIIRGDMSIVGPRPLLVKYLPLYNSEQKHRHDVRPGLTGYAQTNGRNCTSWKERFQNDVFYVNNISFLFDLRIIADTVRIVMKHEGVDSNTTSVFTMTEFKGDENEQY